MQIEWLTNTQRERKKNRNFLQDFSPLITFKIYTKRKKKEDLYKLISTLKFIVIICNLKEEKKKNDKVKMNEMKLLTFEWIKVKSMKMEKQNYSFVVKQEWKEKKTEYNNCTNAYRSTCDEWHFSRVTLQQFHTFPFFWYNICNSISLDLFCIRNGSNDRFIFSQSTFINSCQMS